MIKKLRMRFILVSMLSIIIVIGLILAIINIINYNRVSENADHILELLAKNDGSFGIDKFDPRKDYGPETPYETRYFTVKFYDDGTIITNIHNIAAITDATSAIQMAREAVSLGKNRGYSDVYRYLISTTDNEELVIYMDCSRQLVTFKNFMRASIGVALVGILLVFILIYIFSYRAVEPIAKGYERQKRFITDAGHELKTPLTIISANNELLEMESGENEYTLAISKQINRMNTMIKNLSTLAKLDETERLNSIKEFSLTEGMFNTYNNFKTVLESKYIVNINIEENVYFFGDENLIRQLLTIAFDNCNKYALTKVNINLFKQNNKIILIFENDEQDIKKEELKHVFERFYRSKDARGSNIEGSGIGLSVAKDIVDLHKGIITVNENGEMFELRIVF